MSTFLDPDELDSLIINAIINGDQKAEKYLYERYHDKVGGMLYSRLASFGQLKNMDDFEQHVWIAIFDLIKKGKYKPDLGKAEQYMFGIVKTIVLKYLPVYSRKKEKPLDARLSDKHDFNRYSEESKSEEKEKKKLVRRLIRSASRKNREVLYLFVEGCSYAEIAEKLKMPESSVRGRMSRALGQVKKSIEKNAEKKILREYYDL